MGSEEKKSSQAGLVVFYGIIFLLIGLFFILNLKTSYITDDWHFKFIFDGFWPNENTKRVNDISDIIISMKNFYSMSGGRIMAHSALQAILLFDKLVFDIINTVMFILEGYILYRIVSFRRNPFVILIFFGSLFCFIPSFGETCLWVSGSVNYLWMSIIPLLFIWCIKTEKRRIATVISFFAGLTNEATGGMLIIFIIVWRFIKKKKIDIFSIIQMILLVAGNIFIILAPGNMNRAAQVSNSKVFSISASFNRLGETVVWLVKDGYMFLVLIIVFSLIIGRKHITCFADSISFLLSAFSGMIALTFSDTFIVRAHFFNIIFLLISSMLSLKTILELIKAGKIKTSFLDNYIKKHGEFTKKISNGIVCVVFLFYIVINIILFFNKSGIFFPMESYNSIEYTESWKNQYFNSIGK